MTHDDMPEFIRDPARLAPVGGGHVHLWLADCREWDPDTLANGLSCQERERAKQFRYDLDRSRFIVRRGLLRRLLAHYEQISESELVIEAAPSGRPFLAPRCNPSAIDFSLTRSRDLCLYAITRRMRIGIDMEYVDRQFDAAPVVRQFFAPSEADLLAARPADRHDLFYEMWTSKEACLKATGEGLAVSPAEVVISADRDGRMRTARSRTADWSLMIFRPAPLFVAALATLGDIRATASLTALTPALPLTELRGHQPERP